MARSYTGFRFVKTLDGGPPARTWMPITATAVHEGAVMRVNSGGSALKAAAAGLQLLGVLGAPRTANFATASMPIYAADSNNVFEAKIIASKTPNTLIGDKVTVAVGSTHNFRLTGTTYVGNATACCRIVGFHPDQAPGTAVANGKYWVVFLPTANVVTGSADVTA